MVYLHVFTLLLTARLVVTVPVKQFYPFGAQFGDDFLPRNDDGSSPKVPIQSLFPFFNNQHDSLYVDTNGAVSFLGTLHQFTPDPFPLDNNRRIIAPFWADVDIRSGGSVSYRESTSPGILKRATDDIRNIFPEQYKFQASWVFIVTWNNVPFYGANSVGLYKVGFNSGNSVNYFAVKESRTPGIVNIARMSNVNVPGKFVFRIDTEKIEAGGCNTDGTLTVSPRYGTMLGGQRIYIGGPCVKETEVVTATYGDSDKEHSCQYENEFMMSCVTPVFYTTGNIYITLAIEHDQNRTSHYTGTYSICE